ncbi:HD domain-containing protein [Oleiharenicola lentus]|uniref:HD domain-containing protein n=1 Tax=Oleiharenicola lentus TaxID=2508720 RepID=UPI003F66AFAB
MILRFAELEIKCVQALGVHAAGDAAHDLMHIRRVVANARRLAEVENAKTEVVLPAAWLHDCVTVAKDSPQRAQASRLAAQQAADWLREWNYEERWLPEITHAIEAHSFSAGLAPTTIEAKVVQDADRLDALGAVGLARCLMLGGQMQRSLYVGEDPFCETRSPDDSRAAVDHFYTKLLTLQDTMQTAAGRAEAVRRTEFLKTFLAELKREIGGTR